MGILSKLFGGSTKVDLATVIAQGAQIIDVRTSAEFQGGHLKKAVNIPLDKLGNSLKKISKDKPVITCCASGMRSSSAKSILQKAGYTVYNGGSWTSLRKFE
jgi:rhodanese-related sulfurtransferase